MSYSKILSERILALCEEKNLSTNRLAVLAGLAQSSVNNIVSSRTKNPSVIQLHMIACALNMEFHEFLNFDKLNDLSLAELDKFRIEAKETTENSKK